MNSDYIKTTIKQFYANEIDRYFDANIHFAQRSELLCTSSASPDNSHVANIPQCTSDLASGFNSPLQFAPLAEAMKVVDFGCGSGKDITLASQKLKKGSTVVGIDLSEEMINCAKEAILNNNVTENNILFRVADIEKYPLPRNFADVLISNCVLYQCFDTISVYNNIFRALKPGGTVVITDIVLNNSLSPSPSSLQNKKSHWMRTFIGENDHLHILNKLSFADITLEDSNPLDKKEIKNIIPPEIYKWSVIEHGLEMMPDQNLFKTITISANRPPFSC